MISWMHNRIVLTETFFGRPVKPFHLGLLIATATVGILLAFTHDTAWHGVPGKTLGVLALVSALFLFLGWVTNTENITEWGLLLAAGVWVSRMFYILISGKAVFNIPAASFFLSLAWVVIAAGAYLIERMDNADIET